MSVKLAMPTFWLPRKSRIHRMRGFASWHHGVCNCCDEESLSVSDGDPWPGGSCDTNATINIVLSGGSLCTNCRATGSPPSMKGVSYTPDSINGLTFLRNCQADEGPTSGCLFSGGSSSGEMVVNHYLDGSCQTVDTVNAYMPSGSICVSLDGYVTYVSITAGGSHQVFSFFDLSSTYTFGDPIPNQIASCSSGSNIEVLGGTATPQYISS